MFNIHIKNIINKFNSFLTYSFIFITVSFFILPLIGVMMTLAHYSLIIGLARAPASKIQPFHFTLIFWAIIFGYIFYIVIPYIPTIVGALVIAFSGVFVIRNQTKSN